jgi:hypothetical protein
MFAADVELDRGLLATDPSRSSRLYPRGDKRSSSKTEDDIAAVERRQKAIYKRRTLPPNNPPRGRQELNCCKALFRIQLLVRFAHS